MTTLGVVCILLAIIPNYRGHYSTYFASRNARITFILLAIALLSPSLLSLL